MSDPHPDTSAGGDPGLEALLRGLSHAPPPHLRARVLASMAAAAGARRVVVAARVDPRPAGWLGRRVPEFVAGVAAALAVVAAIPPAAPGPAADGGPRDGEAVAMAANSDVERALLLLEVRRSRILASGVGAPLPQGRPGRRFPL